MTLAERRERVGATVREVFDGYAPFVGRALRYLGLGEADLPDGCQEVFLVVHKKIGELEPGSSVRSWLYAICVRTASEHRRRVRRRHEDPLAPVPEASFDGAVGPDRIYRRSLALAVLDSLDEDKRTVFVLHDVEQLPMREIAELLGIPMQTGYSRLHAGRTGVAEALARARAREGR